MKRFKNFIKALANSQNLIIAGIMSVILFVVLMLEYARIDSKDE